MQQCLTLMLSCGMYDYSGEWAFSVGVPTKSGVSGVLCIVIPGVTGLCTFSPRLDQFGNVYYEGTTDSEGRTRRWVIYNGYAEASAIPPGWHGWMHHRVDTPPTKENYARRDWEKEHIANLTGTPAAYRPDGSILTPASRPKVTGDYDAWTPGS